MIFQKKMYRVVAVFLLMLLAGGLSVLAFAPIGVFPMAFLSLAVLVYWLDDTALKRTGFALGFAWGLGAFGAGVSWLYVALVRYGGMFPPLAVLAIFLFCAFLSLYPALAGMFYVRWRYGGLLRRSLLFAALWVFAEWLRGTLFTGFPWLSIGYSQTPPSPLAGYFPVVGVYGVSGVVALVSGLLALCVAKGVGHIRTAGPALARSELMPTFFINSGVRFSAALAGVILLGGACLSFIRWAEPDGSPLSVSLIQPNIEQSLKWNPAHHAETLQVNAELVRKAQGSIIVLPEAALPTTLDLLPPEYLKELTDSVAQQGSALVVGVFMSDDGRFYNAAVTLGEGSGQRYAKNHLVPFGEYSPPLFGWFYRFVDIPMSRQSTGGANQPPLRLFGRRIAVNICYEDVFGAELLPSLPQAGLMLNLSNLAWYGDSFAQPQHLQIARARAMETGRPMLRSTNTGMTALVLPDGSVPSVQPAFTRGVLEVTVSAYRGLTPYAWWGDVAVMVLAGAVILAAWVWPLPVPRPLR
ncbi:MAG: apolipoprotein N-acyltransferase [Azoarcus sp.]|jgi:apolipoprotein N-acyltransferase|nr:apolipoprotein N-acyltransferase [Azoarcus sp.]